MPRFFKAFRECFRPIFKLPAGLLLLILPGCAGFRPCPEEDAWFGSDKLKHFAAAGAIAGGITCALEDEGREPATAAGLGAAMAAGLGKEWYDLDIKKTCWSWKDLVWDFLGASAGVTAAAALTE